MDPIKEAFQKIKEEIAQIKLENSLLKGSIVNLQTQLDSQKVPISSSPTLLEEQQIPTNPTQSPTESASYTGIPTHNPTLPLEIKGSKTSFYDFSTRNEGVPTDKPTNQQAGQQTDKSLYLDSELDKSNLQRTLESLDNIKKDIRLKFKRLTPQEMQVFSTIYTLENQGFDEISYKTLAKSLNLSESSIRDYITKILLKGIPLQKTKKNNKNIYLSIPSSLQKIATLSTLMRLREL